MTGSDLFYRNPRGRNIQLRKLVKMPKWGTMMILFMQWQQSCKVRSSCKRQCQSRSNRIWWPAGRRWQRADWVMVLDEMGEKKKKEEKILQRSVFEELGKLLLWNIREWADLEWWVMNKWCLKWNYSFITKEPTSFPENLFQTSVSPFTFSISWDSKKRLVFFLFSNVSSRQ